MMPPSPFDLFHFGSHTQAHANAHQPMQPMPYDPFGSLMNPFASMTQSIDRMMQDAIASGDGGNGNSSSTFYYESRTRTVGPDGHVREEVVRRRPGADGTTETQHQVREGRNGDIYTVRGEIESGNNAPADDVVVEELDEYGNVVNRMDADGQVDDVAHIAGNNNNNASDRRDGWWYNRLRSRSNRN